MFLGYSDAPPHCCGCPEYAMGKHCFICIRTLPGFENPLEDNQTIPKAPVRVLQPDGQNLMTSSWSLIKSNDDFKTIPLNEELFLLIEEGFLTSEEDKYSPNFVLRGFLEKLSDKKKEENFGQEYQWWVTDEDCIDEDDPKVPFCLSQDKIVVGYRVARQEEKQNNQNRLRIHIISLEYDMYSEPFLAVTEIGQQFVRDNSDFFFRQKKVDESKYPEHSFGWAMAQVANGRKVFRDAWRLKSTRYKTALPGFTQNDGFVRLEDREHPDSCHVVFEYKDGSTSPLVFSLADIVASDWQAQE